MTLRLFTNIRVQSVHRLLLLHRQLHRRSIKIRTSRHQFHSQLNTIRRQLLFLQLDISIRLPKQLDKLRPLPQLLSLQRLNLATLLLSHMNNTLNSRQSKELHQRLLPEMLLRQDSSILNKVNTDLSRFTIPN